MHFTDRKRWPPSRFLPYNRMSNWTLEQAKPVGYFPSWMVRCSHSFHSVLRWCLLRYCAWAFHTEHCLCFRMPSKSGSLDRTQAPWTNQSVSLVNARFHEVSKHISLFWTLLDTAVLPHKHHRVILPWYLLYSFWLPNKKGLLKSYTT